MTDQPQLFVVDHDADLRFQVQGLVKDAGFVACGQAGLGTEAVAQAADVRPDLILCGLKEPVARVAQTIEALTAALPATPIVVYAGSTDLRLIRRAMLAGARDFLEGPIRPEDLKRSVAAALESEQRRRLHRSEGGRAAVEGSIITVFGAKGGIGKTTLATNLAVAFARHAQQATALVDADDTFGDAAASLALLAEQSIADALRALEPDEFDGVRQFLTPHESGVAVLPSPWDPFEWRDVTGDGVQEVLRRLARQFDVVVVDTASNLSEVGIAALEAASTVLWVTTPDYASVRDTLQALQAVRSSGIADDRIRIVLNISSSGTDVRPRSVESALSLPVFWTIPYDKQLRRSTQLGRPLAAEARTRSPAAEQLVRLALALNGQGPATSTTGLVSRILGGHVLGKRQTRVARKEARA